MYNQLDLKTETLTKVDKLYDKGMQILKEQFHYILNVCIMVVWCGLWVLIKETSFPNLQDEQSTTRRFYYQVSFLIIHRKRYIRSGEVGRSIFDDYFVTVCAVIYAISRYILSCYRDTQLYNHACWILWLNYFCFITFEGKIRS